MHMNKKINVCLDNTINVADGQGGFVDVSEVILSCGTCYNLDDIDVISCLSKQAIYKFTDGMEKEEKQQTGESSELKGSAVLSVIQSSLNPNDFIKIRKSFIHMLSRGIMEIDGVSSISDGLVKKLNINDIYKLLGEYIAGFILVLEH